MAENLKPIQGFIKKQKLKKQKKATQIIDIAENIKLRFLVFPTLFERWVKEEIKKINPKPKNYHLGKLFISVDTSTLDKSSLTHF